MRRILFLAIPIAIVGACALASPLPSRRRWSVPCEPSPEVASVEYRGPTRPRLTVIHLRDLHYVPPEQCKAAGLDFDSMLDAVEQVQADELPIVRHLMEKCAFKLYCEGLTDTSTADLRLRLEVLADLDKIQELAGGLDDKERQHQRELLLEIGIPGKLLRSRDLTTVFPLEDDEALAAGLPKFDKDGMHIDAKGLNHGTGP